jgi:tyrosine-protein kinase Etk/Wzc
MPESESRDAAQANPLGRETINLLDCIEVLAKHNRLIIWSVATVFVLSVAVSLVLPNRYSSTARILPPQQNSGLMGLMMGQTGAGIAGLAGDLLGKGTPADQYVGMLNSEAIADAIIDRFKLMSVYDLKYRLDTYRALSKKVEIAVGKKDGIVSITFEDKDPKRAADIANAYVDELDKMSARLNMTDAGNDKDFLAQRLVKAKADLAQAEDAVTAFQAKNKTFDVMEQAKGTIKGLGELEGQLAIEEVKLAGLRRVFTDDSQDVKNQKSVVANIRGEIAKFEGMHSGATVLGSGAIPGLGQQYLRLTRQFKVQEALVEFLTKQYEVAKLTQAKDIAGVQVIQKATVSDKKSKPKRATLVLSTSFVALVFSVLYAFIREAGARLSAVDQDRLHRIRALLARKRSNG